MSFEYVIHLPCPVKQEVPVEQLVERLKQGRQAQSVLEIVRSQGDQRPPSEILITRITKRPGGMEEKEAVSLQAMMEEADSLMPLAHHCRECPANLAPDMAFGCYQSFSYPIRSATERWLMDRLPASLESTAGKWLLQAIRGAPYDGKPQAAMRADPTFFESRTPFVRSWGSWLSKTRISSDQVLQMLLSENPVGPDRGILLLLILGFLPHDVEAKRVDEALADPQSRLQLIADVDLDDDDASEQESAILGYLYALNQAAILGVPVGTSY